MWLLRLIGRFPLLLARRHIQEALMENPFAFMDSKGAACASGEALVADVPPRASLEDTKLIGATASNEMKPKSIRRAKTWSDEVENLYRFQQAGYRDEIEYKQVKQVDMVDRWPETGFVKKLQRRDNTFYYYDKERECEDKEVRKVKVYAY